VSVFDVLFYLSSVLSWLAVVRLSLLAHAPARPTPNKAG